jgi:D-alanyl-D-alanine dipeptidase
MLKTAIYLLLTGLAAFETIAQLSGSLPPIEQKMVERGLVDIQKVDRDIMVELKYSTTDNFIGRDVYGELTRAYLQPEMAKRLAKANALLKQQKPGYKLLVYDAARPNSAQYDLWNALDHLKIPARSKTQYVADPKIGSNHNFGCAIDLTVTDDKSIPLDMGTKFDYFGPLAYPRSEQEMLKKGKLTTKQVENRQLLRKVMTQAGFKVNTTEWWHFDGMSKAQARAKYGMIP